MSIAEIPVHFRLMHNRSGIHQRPQIINTEMLKNHYVISSGPLLTTLELTHLADPNKQFVQNGAFEGLGQNNIEFAPSDFLEGAKATLEIAKFRRTYHQKRKDIFHDDKTPLEITHMGYALASSLWYLSKRLNMDPEELMATKFFPISVLIYNQMFHIEDEIVDENSFRTAVRKEHPDFKGFVQDVMQSPDPRSNIKPSVTEQIIIDQLKALVDKGGEDEIKARRLHSIYTGGNLLWLATEYQTILDPINSNYQRSFTRLVNNTLIPSQAIISIISEGLESQPDNVVVSDCIRAAFVACTVDHMLDLGEDMAGKSLPLIEAVANESKEGERLAALAETFKNEDRALVFDLVSMDKRFPKTTAKLINLLTYNLDSFSQESKNISRLLALLVVFYPMLAKRFGKYLPVASEVHRRH